MRVVRLLKVRNEIEIIEQNLDFYANQNIPSIVLDNLSSDGTLEVCKKGLKNGAVIKLEILPTEGFDRTTILRRLDQMCKEYSPDWVVVADADEFMETPKLEQSLLEGINEQEFKGNNLIQIANMEFWMTPEDKPNEKDIMKRIKYYSFFPSQLFRIYKYAQGTSLVRYNNHAPEFQPSHKVTLSDDLFIMRHYKFQSLRQARDKIRRIVSDRKDKTVGFHYQKFGDDKSYFIIPASKLNYYNDNKEWNFEVKFFGNRMSKEELKEYLRFQNSEQLEEWFRQRNPYYRNFDKLMGVKNG